MENESEIANVLLIRREWIDAERQKVRVRGFDLMRSEAEAAQKS